MPIYSSGTALFQDSGDVLCALGLGTDQDELAVVRESGGVGIDHIVGQMTVGKMGPECGYCGRIGFNGSYIVRWPSRRQDRADRNWTHSRRLFGRDGLIVNSGFKPRGASCLSARSKSCELSNIPTTMVSVFICQ